MRAAACLGVLLALGACTPVGEGRRPQEGGPGGAYYGVTTTTTAGGAINKK